MANIKASEKDIRSSAKRKVQNAHDRARLRTFDKKVRALVLEGSIEDAQVVYKQLTRYLDRAGKKNLIHPRQADRKKSRVANLINRAIAASKEAS